MGVQSFVITSNVFLIELGYGCKYVRYNALCDFTYM